VDWIFTMGVIIKALLLVSMAFISCDASTYRYHMYCPWNGWEIGTPHLFRKTAQGYVMVRQYMLLYLFGILRVPLKKLRVKVITYLNKFHHNCDKI